MQVSKQVLVGAGVAFLALFGAVVFLLGRESRRPKAQAAVVSQAATEVERAPAYAPPPTVPALPTTASAVQEPPVARVEPSVRSGIVESSPRGGVVESDPKVLPPSISVTAGDDGAAIRDYFQKMQTIQMYGPSGDTGEFANKLLASSMTGDSSGFDDLVKAAQAGAEKARAITPPAAAAEYHARMIAMLGESVGMVKQIKTAIASGDPGQLSALAASGSSLQNRATALEAEAKQIKARYGVR